MNNDKQPSNGADNSGATDSSVPQGIFTPNPTTPPAQPAQTPVVTGSVVEPATTGLSHPYVSNHPTQTTASGVGDIVIGKNGKKISPKKPLVIGGIIGAVIAVIIAIVAIVGLVSNDDKAVIALFEKYNAPMRDTQAIFTDAYLEKLTVADIFNEQFHSKLDGYLSQLEEFQTSISKIKPSRISLSARDDFAKTQQEIAKFIGNYRRTVELFNKLYESYNTDNPSNLSGLLEDENYAVTVVADRFNTFLEKKQKLSEVISAKSCALDMEVKAIPTTECEYLVGAYLKNTNNLQQSVVVVQTLFSAYGVLNYGAPGQSLYQKMNDIINFLSKEENA